MPRTSRASVGGVCYHVLNRGNNRGTVFHNPDDYDAFVDLAALANQRLAMRVLAFALMPTHFHLVLWPHRDGDLSRWMQWLLTSHVRRHRRHHGGIGHIWQGRFKAFPIQQDDHLYDVLRFVERNPLRARLVAKAEDWAWTSLACRRADVIAEWPVPRPRNWRSIVQAPQTEAELAALQRSVVRGTPYGSDAWSRRVAKRLGLESSLRPRGRPKKK